MNDIEKLRCALEADILIYRKLSVYQVIGLLEVLKANLMDCLEKNDLEKE
jgi:hypothetical protein